MLDMLRSEVVVTAGAAGAVPKPAKANAKKAAKPEGSGPTSAAGLEKQLKVLLSLDLTTNENLNQIRARVSKDEAKWDWANSFLHSIKDEEKKRDAIKASLTASDGRGLLHRPSAARHAMVPWPLAPLASGRTLLLPTKALAMHT